MKNMNHKNGWKRILLLYVMTLAFWGMLYPQFSLVEETYEYVEVKEENVSISQECGKEEIKSKRNAKEDFIAILDAKQGEIRIKSKIWEFWKKVAEKK